MNLTSDQRRVVELRGKALLVRAGPGSGKTLVLTRRVLELIRESNDEYRVLAVTFTRKAADEMRARIQGSLPDFEQEAFIGTMHSFCHDVILSHVKDLNLSSNPTIFEKREDLARVMQKAVDADPSLSDALQKAFPNDSPEFRLKNALDAIAATKRELAEPDARQNRPIFDLYQGYQNQMAKLNALDFDDLLVKTHQLFEVRPEVLGLYGRIFRHVCVDEAQDLNHSQYEIIRMIGGQNPNNIVLAGDPNQNIFSWNGASRRFMAQFVKDFHAEVVNLEENFRSDSELVKIAGRVLPGSTRQASPLGTASSVCIRSFHDQAAEAEGIVSEISRILSADSGGDMQSKSIAILARTSYGLLPFEPALNAAGIEYWKRVAPQDRFQTAMAEDLELLLRLGWNLHDSIHLEELSERWGTNESILRALIEGHPAVDSRDLEPYQSALIQCAASSHADREDFDLDPYLDALDAAANDLEEEDAAALNNDCDILRMTWSDFLRSSSGVSHTIAGFLSFLGSSGGHRSRASNPPVSLLTIHSSKGLEFDEVYVVGMYDGLFPHYRATTENEIDEERRNLYVAMTRARKRCNLSYPETTQNRYGRTYAQNPSRFLADLGVEPPATSEF